MRILNLTNQITKLLLFISVQILISLLIIVCFWIQFHTHSKMIIFHLIIICVFHIVIATICLSILTALSHKILPYVKYIFTTIYGVFTVFLFLTYMLAFNGKAYNSQIFTFDIFFGYLKNLNGFLQSMSVSYILAYSVLFAVPASIIGFSLCFSNLVYSGFFRLSLLIKNKIAEDKYKSFYKYIAIPVLLGGIMIVFIFTKYPVLSIMFDNEDPITSVLISMPYQGQHINNDYLNREQSVRASYPKNIKFNRKNVVIIIIDALRADHLHLFGYNRDTSPFLDSLYGSGNLRKIGLSFSPAGASIPGINGILRSKIWANIGFGDFSIQKLLQDQGYKINFILSGDHTHFYGMKSFYGANEDLDYFIDGSETKKYHTNDDRIIFEGLDNIGQSDSKSSFFYFHLVSVHTIGVRQEQYRLFKPDLPGKLDIENYINRYDNGVRQADSYLQSIFYTLKKKNYLQNSIVVITGHRTNNY
jgi:glucan phosphoethanolaminetransferase (alkaline phosphatase superfamily)